MQSHIFSRWDRIRSGMMGIRVIVEGMYAHFEPGMLNLFEVANEQPVWVN